MNFNTLLKIGIGLMLLACLLDMPYGFYQIVRFVSSIGFGYLAFEANTKQKQRDTIIFGILVLLFQPFLKVSLGRELWNIVDVGVAIFLIAKAIKEIKTK